MAVTVQMQIKVMKNKPRVIHEPLADPDWTALSFDKNDSFIFLPDLSSSHGIHYKSM